ncbi:MAG: hypothetical protein QM791_08860 [Ferruginibacter sp.]
MKNIFFVFILFLFSCNNNESKPTETVKEPIPDTVKTEEAIPAPAHQISWAGTINKKVPVFLTYNINESIITGQITYLNTKDKKPIKLIGTIEDDRSFRLLEFESTGNITGIITGKPGVDSFNGAWFSPKTRKELEFAAVKKDTTVAVENTAADLADIAGNYHYQYSEEGSMGDLDIKQLSNGRAVFAVSSVTSAPARNLADVPGDTIDIKSNSFIYKIPGTDSCEFKVKFYKSFAYINYTRGFCDGQFGHNATIDGIFLKVK